MQNNNFRLITDEELNKVNPKITADFGMRSKITSGTCQICDDGKKRYNIVMENIVSHQPIVMIEEIGKYVQQIWGADEVYYFGVKIA